MRTCLNASFILLVSFLSSCSSEQKKNEEAAEEKSEIHEQAPATVSGTESLSDTVFSGFRYGMSFSEAKDHVAKLKSQGEKINLSGNDDKLSGECIFNNGKRDVSSEMIIFFANDKLSAMQIKIKCDMEKDQSVTDALHDLAEYLSKTYGPYQTDEDAMHYEYHFWDDGNRLIKIFQSDGHEKSKCMYNIEFKDSRLDSSSQS